MHQSFAPQSCDRSKEYRAVTLGPGSQWGDVYTTLAKHNLTVVGGGCETVSIGGFMTGGGYGALTASRGLAVDSLLGIELLLANGSVVVANACQNSDLFWATRGVSQTYLFLLSRRRFVKLVLTSRFRAVEALLVFSSRQQSRPTSLRE